MSTNRLLVLCWSYSRIAQEITCSTLLYKRATSPQHFFKLLLKKSAARIDKSFHSRKKDTSSRHSTQQSRHSWFRWQISKLVDPKIRDCAILKTMLYQTHWIFLMAPINSSAPTTAPWWDLVLFCTHFIFDYRSWWYSGPIAVNWDMI